MGMAVENKEISFDTMQQELQIGADDVEAFVIDGKQLEHFHFFPRISPTPWKMRFLFLKLSFMLTLLDPFVTNVLCLVG